VATSQAAPAEPILPRAGWILGPSSDFLLFLGTPLLIVPLIALAQVPWTVPALYVAVASFGSVGHHLPGMMRAYGDRALFERFKLRFVVAPIFLVVTCVAFNLWQQPPLGLVLLAWGLWHLFMQAHGLARIYDGKVGSTDAVTVRLDFLLLGTWFIAIIVLSDLRLPLLLLTLYKCGVPLVASSTIAALRHASLLAIVAVTLVYAAHALRRARGGTPPNFVKLALHASTIGFFWFCNFRVEHVLLAILMFELFHDVQYLAIVWVFNRRRAASPGAGAFTRFLFRRRAYLVLLYVGMVAAYGALSLAGRRSDVDSIDGVIGGLVFASTLLHFYYDGFIWKLRETEVSRTLGVKADEAPGWARSQRRAGGAGHALKWAYFVAPLALLTLGAQSATTTDAQRFSSVAELAPTNGSMQAKLAEVLAREGDLAGAIEAGRRALEHLTPDGPHADLRVRAGQNLVTALMRRSIALVEQGDPEAAAPLAQEAVALDPAVPSKVRATAKSAHARANLAVAGTHYTLATSIDPLDLESWVGLAQVRAAEGRLAEARRCAERAAALAPDAPAVVALRKTLARSR
jgi:tetratricopeptide (TPR) repeat protein